MDTGFLHLHNLVVTLYLLQLIVKVILVAMKKDAFLEKNAKKIKILDMVLGPLLLITGGYLYIKMLMDGDPRGTSAFMILKLVLVFASIPLGIIGMRKKKLPLLILSVLLLVYVFAMSKTGDVMLRSAETQQTTLEDELKDKGVASDMAVGQSIYVTRCQLCHGEDGKMGFQGAKDLTETELSDAEMIGIIRDGKGVMPAVSELDVSDQKIDEVIKYVRSLTK